MDEKTKTSPLFLIIATVFGIIALYFLYGAIIPKWTLMECSTVMPNGLECESILRTSKWYSWDEKLCIGVGRDKLLAIPAFECGRGCHYDGNFWVCKEICNMKGVCN